MTKEASSDIASNLKEIYSVKLKKMSNEQVSKILNTFDKNKHNHIWAIK